MSGQYMRAEYSLFSAQSDFQTATTETNHAAHATPRRTTNGCSVGTIAWMRQGYSCACCVAGGGCVQVWAHIGIISRLTAKRRSKLHVGSAGGRNSPGTDCLDGLLRYATDASVPAPRHAGSQP